MSTFTLMPSADTNKTHLLANVYLIPAKLVLLFGPPVPVDEYKVSGEYVFQDEEGHVFTLYDWKCTSLYWDEEGIKGSPTPDEFWATTRPVQLKIGGRRNCGRASDFAKWLKIVAPTPSILSRILKYFLPFNRRSTKKT